MKHLKIGSRLGIGFGIVILLIGIIVSIAMFRMSSAEQRVNNILEDRYRKIAMMSQVKYNVALIHQHMRSALIEGDAEGVRKETAAIDALRAKNKELLDAFDKIINVPKAREIFTEIVKMRANDLALQKELFALVSSGNQQEAKELLKTRIRESEQAYVKRISEMIDLQTQKMEEESAFMRKQFSESRIEFTILAVLAMTFSLFAAAYVTRSITSPMKEAVDVARRVAHGDLSVDIAVRSHDETGELLQALKEMTEALASIVGEVRSSAETISSASQQIASGNADLSSRTEAQAGSLEETASSMEELTSTVKQNADNARQANALAVTASEVAVKGGAVVSEVVQTMGSINDSARKIVDIIAVIDGIAFQTNILALNAAVEATRAGEQGRGFAVVAAEVRSLAQRSASAAKEIKTLITNSVAKVDAGSRLVDQAGATMQEVVESIRRVTDIMAEISAASAEQTAGIEQVNQAVSQMGQVTQQNAALVEESAAASEAMREQPSVLAKVVSVFKTRGTPGTSAPRARIVPSPQKPAAPASGSDSPLQVKRLAAAGSASSADWDEF